MLLSFRATDDMETKFFESFLTQAKSNSARAAYIFLDRNLNESSNLTFENLLRNTLNIANNLQQMDSYRKPVLVLYHPNINFILAFIGCILAGAIPVPITRRRGQGIDFHTEILSKTGAALLINTSRAVSETWGIPLGVREISTEDLLSPTSHHYTKPILDDNDVAFVQYTSGSMQKPKGVSITYQNLIDNLSLIKSEFAISQEDIGLSWLPFSHDMGLIGHVLTPFFCGITNYFISPTTFAADPIKWLRGISKFKATISGGPCFAFNHCLTAVSDEDAVSLKLETWRLAYCGAEKVSPNILRGFARKFLNARFSESAFFPCYGMAESTLYVCGKRGLKEYRSSVYSESLVCIGSSVAERGVEIVDVELLEPVQDGAAGEIVIMSNSVANGYYLDDISSKGTFGTTINGSAGYMRTGDLGVKFQNELYFLGRIKNMIKIRGLNYYPEDIEMSLLEHLSNEKIKRCAVFQFDDEDGKFAVILEQDRGKLNNIQAFKLSTVYAYLSSAFGITPSDVLMLPSSTIPLTTSGKVERAKLRNLYRRNVEKD